MLRRDTSMGQQGQVLGPKQIQVPAPVFSPFNLRWHETYLTSVPSCACVRACVCVCVPIANCPATGVFSTQSVLA